MSFGLYLALATVVILLIQWVIWLFTVAPDEDRSFLMVMLDGQDSGIDTHRMISFGLIAVAVVIGAVVVE